MLRFAAIVCCGLLLVLLVVQGGFAASFSIEPFKVLLVPERGKTTQLFKFANAGNTPQAVQVRAESWSMDDQGREMNEADKDSFSIYPAQFVLQPRGEQNVRVTWLKEAPQTEQAFRLVAEQLPVDFPDVQVNPDEPAIRYLLTYRAALYVAPAKAKSEVTVNAFQEKTLEDGTRVLELEVANKGLAHTLLKSPVLKITDRADAVHTLSSGAQIEALSGQNVMPGKVRRLLLPWPEGMPEGIKAVALDFTAGL